MPHIPTINDITKEAKKLAKILENKPSETRISLPQADPGSTDEAHQEGVVYSILPANSLSDAEKLLVHYVPLRRPTSPYIGLDGSSRKLEAYNLLLGVYSVAVSVVDGVYTVGTYPDTGVYPAIDANGAAIASLAPEVKGAFSFIATRPLIDPVKLVDVTNCRQKYGTSCDYLQRLGYGAGYNIPTMLDENRSFLENSALEYIYDHAALHRNGARVLLDGPIYMTPGLLVQFYRAVLSINYGSVRLLTQLVYVLSYLLNSIRRARLVNEIRSKGALVAGIVKRINRSRLLVNAAYGLGATDLPDTDPQLVEKILRNKGVYQSIPTHAYGVAFALGPIISVIDLKAIANHIERVLGMSMYPLSFFDKPVTRSGETLAYILRMMHSHHFLVKRSYYLVVKDSLLGYQMLRVEFPQQFTEFPARLHDGRVVAEKDPQVLRRLVSIDREILGEIAWLTTQPSRLTAPLPIALSDHVSRTVSRDLARIWFNELQGRVTFTYETLLEIAA